jgi:8-oxo-dGTP diphosphatase
MLKTAIKLLKNLRKSKYLPSLSSSKKLLTLTMKQTIKDYLKTNPILTYAVVCFLLKGDEILLGVREKVSQGLGQDLIAGIGGKREGDETDDQTLLREVEEEIGVKLGKYEYKGRVKFYFPHKPKWNQDVAVYIATEWIGEPHKVIPNDSESGIIDPKWFKLDAIPYDKMWEDNERWLPQILKGEDVSMEFLFDENVIISDETIHS